MVSVVLVGTERDTVLQRLEALEARSRKGQVKWHRARYAFRQDDIAGLTDIPHLAASIFATTFRNAQNYFELTVKSRASCRPAHGAGSVR